MDKRAQILAYKHNFAKCQCRPNAATRPSKKLIFLVLGFAQDTPNVFEIGMAFPVRRSKTKRKSQPSRSAPFYDSYTALFNQFKIDGELKKDISTNMVQICGSQKQP